MTANVMGRKGKGKSNALASFIARRSKPTIIIDNMLTFKSIINTPYFLSVDDLIQYCIEDKLNVLNPVAITLSPAIFSQLCELIMELKNIQFIIDEVDLFDAPTSVNPVFRDMINYQRHYGIDIITSCRRPANISRDLTAQTDYFLIYQITEGIDLEYFKKIDYKLPDIIRKLPDYHYIKYDYNTIEVCQPLPLYL